MGKGNGAYSKHVNTKGFLADTAIHDVRNLTNCVNDPISETYQKFVKKAWVAANETPLWTTFSGSYIDDEDFSNYHAGSSGIAGLTPDNNPTERFMEIVKGTKRCRGLLRIGYDVGTMFSKELPDFIYLLAQVKIGVVGHKYF